MQFVLLWGVVVGLSTGFIGGYLAAFIAARWFRAHEGLVVGILTAANAAGQLVFLPTMAALATHAGWRMMSLGLGRDRYRFPAAVRRKRPILARRADHHCASLQLAFEGRIPLL